MRSINEMNAEITQTPSTLVTFKPKFTDSSQFDLFIHLPSTTGKVSESGPVVWHVYVVHIRVMEEL